MRDLITVLHNKAPYGSSSGEALRVKSSTSLTLVVKLAADESGRLVCPCQRCHKARVTEYSNERLLKINDLERRVEMLEAKFNESSFKK